MCSKKTLVINDPYNSKDSSLQPSKTFLEEVKKSIRNPSGPIAIITSRIQEADSK